MRDVHNADYGVDKLRALRAYVTNAFNINGQSTRSEYWWLLPWLILFELTTLLTIGNCILPQLTIRSLLVIPTAAITARRYRDAGIIPLVGLCQVLFACSTWWLLYAFASSKVSDLMLWVWLAAWGISEIVKLVITLMPTQQATAVITHSQAIAEYRARHHLNADELNLFRDTMGTTKRQILELGTDADSSVELARILRVTGGLHAAQELFRHLMAHPHELTEHADFLYKMLPQLVAASEEFITAEQAEVHDPKVSMALQMMAESLKCQAQAITDDYAQVLQANVEVVGAHG